MKTRILLLLFCLCWLSLTAFAQLSQCTVTGTLYKPDGNVCASCQIKIVKTYKNGALVSITPITITSNASGVLTFTVPRGSITWLSGNVIGFSQCGNQGCPVSIPDASTATLETLVPSPAALPNSYPVVVSGGAGSGTVTSVAMSVPSWLSVSGSPVTDSGTLAVTAATGQTANRVLASPDGTSGAVSLRALVANDIPTLPYSKLTLTGAVLNADLAGSIAISKLAITGTPDGTKFLRDDGSWQALAGVGDALTSNPLSQFAATTSAQLASVLSDETGSDGGFVRATSPTLTTPTLGIASATRLMLTGTGGGGYANYIAQSSAPGAPGDGFNLFADSSGRFSWISASDGFIRIFDATLTANRTYTLPDVSGQVSIINATQTLTNKTISGASNTLTNIGNASLTNSAITIAGSSTSLGGSITASTILDSIGSTRGSILYRGASGWAILPPGPSGQVLTSNGAGADPSYQAGGGGGGTPGGSSGDFQYNNAGSFGGTTGVVYSGSGTTVTVTGQQAAQVVGQFVGAASASAATLVVKGGSAQTGNLFEAQNSSGTAQTRINSSGNLYVPALGYSTTSLFFGSPSSATGFASSTVHLATRINGMQVMSVSQNVVAINNNTKLEWSSIPNGLDGDTSISRHAANVVRIGDGGARLGAGSLLIGTSSGSIGTSGVGVLAIMNGTAPTSSPADLVQLYSADFAAGDARLRLRTETGTQLTLGNGAYGTIQASGSDTAGNNVTLYAGPGTGTGAGGSVKLQTSIVGTSGSTVNTLVDRFIVNGARKALTDAADNSLFEVALPTLKGAMGTVRFEIFATDGTDVQVRRGTVQYSAVNKDGIITKEISVVNEAASASSGTLTTSWDILNGINKITIRVTPSGSLTETVLYILYTIENNSEQAITIL